MAIGVQKENLEVADRAAGADSYVVEFESGIKVMVDWSGSRLHVMVIVGPHGRGQLFDSWDAIQSRYVDLQVLHAVTEAECWYSATEVA